MTQSESRAPAAASPTDPRITVLIAEYNENCAQARNHEALRERLTNSVALLTGAVIGLLALKDKGENGFYIYGNYRLLFPSIFLSAVAMFGVIAARVHYNKNRNHVERLTKAKKELHRIVQLP